MNNSNQSLTERKEYLRYKALEKEVCRLKNKTSKQKKQIVITSSVIIFLIFFVGTETFMLFNRNQQLKNGSSIQQIQENKIDSIALHPNNTKNNSVSFKIQVGAYAKSVVSLQKYKENLVELNEDVKGNNKVFTLGSFKKHIDAIEFLELVKKIGFDDAFIVAYDNKNVILIQDAIKITSL